MSTLPLGWNESSPDSSGDLWVSAEAGPIATGPSLGMTTSKPGPEKLHEFCRNPFKPEDDILIYISPPLTFLFDQHVLSFNSGENAMKYYGSYEIL